MKNGFLKLMIIAITLIISFSAECIAGNRTSHSVSLRKQYKEHNQDLDPEGESSNLCKASFLEDIPFCQYLFNTPDNYQIRISTTDFILIGYISTL